METTDSAIRLPGLTGALRIWSAARALLALLGLAVLLTAALPGPRETLLKQLAAWTEAWEEQNDNISAGTITIQPGFGSAAVREQRAVS